MHPASIAVRRRLQAAAVASLAALPFGFAVQRGLSFELVRVEEVGGWAVLLWPGVVLALGLAAAFVVAPLGGLLARRPAGRLSDLAARTGFSALAGTGGFYLLTGFPVLPLEAALVALPQLAFFACLHLWLDRGRATSREAPPVQDLAADVASATTPPDAPGPPGEEAPVAG